MRFCRTMELLPSFICTLFKSALEVRRTPRTVWEERGDNTSRHAMLNTIPYVSDAWITLFY